MVIDGNILISGSDDCTIRQWDLASFAPAGVVGSHEEGVQDLLFLRESGLLMSCGQEKLVKVWKYEKGDCVGEIAKSDELRCLDYVIDSNHLLIGTGCGTILTHQITEYLSYFDSALPVGFEMDDYEAQPHEEEEDALDGADLNSEFARLQKEQQYIMQQDGAGWE